MPSPASRELFARPMPYEVSWRGENGRFTSVTSYSRLVAEQVFDEVQARGDEPMLYLGGLLIEETGSSSGGLLPLELQQG